MKRITLALCVATLLFLLPGAAFGEQPARLGSVSGGGRPIADGVSYSFAFSAVQTDARGNATGQMEWMGTSGQRIHGEVLYLWTDVTTNRAWIGCKITNSNSPDLPVDSEYVFEVMDNGEGANSVAPDRASLRHFGTIHGAFEAVVYGYLGWDLGEWLDWTTGNIQIRYALPPVTDYPM